MIFKKIKITVWFYDEKGEMRKHFELTYFFVVVELLTKEWFMHFILLKKPDVTQDGNIYIIVA